MLSCIVPSLGEKDKINSHRMPSSPVFAMQFPSMVSGLSKDDESSAPHTNFFPKCHQCQTTFTSLQALKEHIDVIHSIEKHHHQQQYNRHHHQQQQHQHQQQQQHLSSSGTPSPPLQTTNNHHHHQQQHQQHHPQHQYQQNQQQQHHQATSSASVSSLTSLSAASDECGRSTSPTTLSSSVGGPHACSQCSASFPNRDLLDKHELLHSPNSTVSCKICHKTFANVYRLQRHMISHDESALLRKFKCTDCDKAFKFKHHLKEHIRIHSGEKPFACNNCGKRFSHSGSYSSHMTSKKCISMGLKLNNGRILNKADRSIRMKDEHMFSPNKQRTNNYLQPNIPGVGLNNNSTTSPNHNHFLSMLPKCNSYDAMNAALFATFQNPFLPMTFDPRNAFNPYSLQRFIELTAGASPQSAAMESLLKSTAFPNKTPSLHSDPEDMIEEVTEDVNDEPKLVMDLDDDEKFNHEDEKPSIRSPSPPPEDTSRNDQNGNYSNDDNDQIMPNNLVKAELDLSIMRSVTPDEETKVEIEDDIQDDDDDVDEDNHKNDDVLQCSKCAKTFNHRTELAQHETVLCGMFRKHEGLAAQMAETIALNGNYLSMASGSEDEDRDSKMMSEGERKVRVRTAISEEQQIVLKEHYSTNPRPNRDEFRTIAQRLMLDPRVVQVWFQNNRSRERKLNNIAYKKDYPSPIFGHTTSSPSVTPPVEFDQPLDLSLKKESTTSTPSSSPRYGANVLQSYNSIADEVMNLSLKTEASRGATPYRHLFNYGVALTNRSSESQTPSPSQAHTPYSYMISNPALGLVPMERLLQMTPELPRNPLLGLKSDRDNSLSPGSEKRLWKDESRFMTNGDGVSYLHHITKRPNTQKEQEAEGQFVCDQCDKAFSKQSSLARHKYEHSGQRPYKCVECPKAFKHKHHLTEHKRLHSGEKPFQCSKCLKRFSHSGSYSQHMNHRYSYCKPYRE